jgi:hypothetical protein
MQYLTLIKYPQTYILLVPLAKQNEKEHKNKKHKSSVVGNMVAFSICNKHFKPLGIPWRTSEVS